MSNTKEDILFELKTIKDGVAAMASLIAERQSDYLQINAKDEKAFTITVTCETGPKRESKTFYGCHYMVYESDTITYSIGKFLLDFLTANLAPANPEAS